MYIGTVLGWYLISLSSHYYYYYYLIKFNVHIQPLGYDRHQLHRRAP
jgi:hypothetical protein